jgi:8-oxo-dGTP diphosphatase
MKSIEVVAAIIVYKGKILCVQRGENKLEYISKKYEFPGGKIEPGESQKESIKREILEELKIEIDVQEDFMTVRHQYPDFHLTMHSFICKCINPNLTLTEHIDYKWLKTNELDKLDWAAADIPIMEKLRTYSNEFTQS